MLHALKKIGSGIALTGMALIGLTFVTVLPAQASETSSQVICHATGSETNPFVKSPPIPEQAIVKGGHGSSGVNAGDIIPPFDYNFGGKDAGTYPGQNWTEENQRFWANGCSASNTVLTPNLAAPSIQATCMNPTATGLISVPEQPANVTAAEPVAIDGGWKIIFSKTADTVFNTYQWVKGFAGEQIVNIIPAGPGDPYWDETKGACNLPDTGAGQSIQWWMIPAGAGMLLLAAILFIVKPLIGRRINA